ncbi:hypothetical protein Taro_031227 [Colocasia esculenta]|uniref:Protein PLASTID MOVEMENT IMPAIRED 1-RELATED 1 n=1 Tax=Colocasia esculenta TaxID=4460 RepID=A0A843W2J0_COLES|nr:hypothetical protein [Colocasia esculenta]
MLAIFLRHTTSRALTLLGADTTTRQKGETQRAAQQSDSSAHSSSHHFLLRAPPAPAAAATTARSRRSLGKRSRLPRRNPCSSSPPPQNSEVSGVFLKKGGATESLISRKAAMLRKPEPTKRSAAAGDPGGGGRLLDEIEALSRALSLTKKPAGGAQKPLPPDPRFRSMSAGKSHFPDPKAKLRAPPRRDPQPPPPPQKEKRMLSSSAAAGASSFSSSTSSSIWNWKPLRALSHIRHRRFDCRFTLQVHSVEGLPPGFNNAGLVVHWKRNLAEIGLRTRPASVIGGAAEFEETLEHRCAVYGSRGGGPHHAAKYEARQFVLYPAVVGAPELDLGKHRVDLTRLLPLTLEELEEDSSGKWSTSFKLSGKARGATLNVSFGFSFLAGGDVAESGGYRKVSELLLAEAEAEEAEDRVSKQGSLRRLGSVPVANPASKGRPRFLSQSLDDVKVLHEILPTSQSDPVGLLDAEHVPADAKCDDDELDTPADGSNSEVSPVLKAGALPELMEGDEDKEFDCPEFTVIEHGIEIATKDRVTDDAEEHDELREVDEGCRPDSEDNLVGKGVPQDVDKGHGDGSEESSAKLAAMGRELLPCDDGHGDDVVAAGEPAIESLVSEFSACDPCGHSHGDDIMLAGEPAMEDLASALQGLSISESAELEPQKVEDNAPEQPSYMEMKSNYKTGKMSKSLSLDDVTESVASEFLSMLGIEHSPFGLSSDSDPESPRERLWKQFKKETLSTKENIFDLDMEKSTELLDWGEYPEDFNLSTIVHAAETEHEKATQALKSKTRAKILEDAETEALMREWGLNENAFHNSPPGSGSGFGSPIDLPPEDPLELPPLGEGLGPFIQTKDGGFLRSMNPSLFNNSKHNGSLIMQVSSPVVVPAEMGSNVMEILQHLASAGIEKLSMQASKLMPLEDITGRTMQQVAWESLPAIDGCERHDLFQHVNPEAESGPSYSAAGKRKKGKYSSSTNSSAAEIGSDYVSLEDLAPLAMEKMEALSIEGLRIQSGMSDEDAPSNISPQSIGEISALEGKEAKNNRSLGLEGAAGLQLLDVKDNGDDVDGLMGLSISLDEWMRLDSGVIDEDEISDRTSKVLAAHHAASAELVTGGWKGERRGGRNSGKRWGLLGNNFTVALMVQLRDPLRNYEPVGTPMLALVQVERVFIPPKPKIYCTVSDKGNSEQDEEPETKVVPAKKEEKKEEEEVIPQFKITEVHVAGLKTDPGKKKLWGNATQQQSGSRWLLAQGMGKSNKHPFMKSKAITKPSQVEAPTQVTTPSQVAAPSQAAAPQVATTVKPGDTLWSISSRAHGTGAKWKQLAKLNPHIRNPNIILPNETIRLR